jgi:hypothetical protein
MAYWTKMALKSCLWDDIKFEKQHDISILQSKPACLHTLPPYLQRSPAETSLFY